MAQVVEGLRSWKLSSQENTERGTFQWDIVEHAHSMARDVFAFFFGRMGDGKVETIADSDAVSIASAFGEALASDFAAFVEESAYRALESECLLYQTVQMDSRSDLLASQGNTVHFCRCANQLVEDEKSREAFIRLCVLSAESAPLLDCFKQRFVISVDADIKLLAASCEKVAFSAAARFRAL
jgi:hypothetical protein